MQPLIHGQTPLLLGALFLAALMGVRAFARDPALRKDLWGAIVFLLGSMAVRGIAILIDPYLSRSYSQALSAAWTLLFAFGIIRAGVSAVLWFLRLSLRPTPKILRDVIDFTLYSLVAVPILKSQLDIDLTGILATSAIVSVVIGLAMQDTLGNLFAGLSIQLERPFQVGDSITIDAHTGKVVQVAWRATRIENTRREVITLPNNILSKQPVKNYSRGAQPIGVDVPIRAPHDVPPNRVKDVVLGLLSELPLVLAQPAPRCFVSAYEDSAIRYTVRYFLADFMQADQALDHFYSRLWYRFRREGIATPIPQRQTFMVDQRAESPTDELPLATRAELLGTVDLFESLGEEDRRKLSAQMSPRRFGKGEQIIAQGTPGTTFYLVASGEVSVWAGAKPDLELARLRRGQYFGEMSLLTGEPRAATVTAATDVLLLELDREIFAQLFANHPGLMRRLSALLAQRKNQLEAAAESFDPVVGPAPEAGRILGRLRQMFGLNLD